MISRVKFKSLSGKTISGIINAPRRRPPFFAVIICHGYKGYKEQVHLKSLAGALAKAGILALRFDFGNGLGESYGQMQDIRFDQYLNDLKAAVGYLKSSKLVDKNRIGLAGHSFGGKLILHYAAANEVKALADLAGLMKSGDGDAEPEKRLASQFKEIIKQGYFCDASRSKRLKFKVNVEFYFDMVKNNTYPLLKKIKTPTLIIHGSADNSVPLQQSKRAYKLLTGPKKLVVIAGAPHTWRQPIYYKKINPVIVNWFKKYL